MEDKSGYKDFGVVQKSQAALLNEVAAAKVKLNIAKQEHLQSGSSKSGANLERAYQEQFRAQAELHKNNPPQSTLTPEQLRDKLNR